MKLIPKLRKLFQDEVEETLEIPFDKIAEQEKNLQSSIERLFKQDYSEMAVYRFFGFSTEEDWEYVRSLK